MSGVRAERDQQDVPRVDRANEKSAGDRTAGALVVAQRAIGNRAVLALMRRSAPPGRRVLARRRIPSQAELEQILLDPSGAGTVEAADVAEHRAGLRRLIEMSRHEMTAQQRARVNVKRQEGLTAVQWGALTDTQKAIREASAIIAVRPDTRLGDPLLIDTGPRPGTSDAAHVTQLVNSANAILDRIATGAVDGHIKQVFGAAKLADAKARYANARVRLNFLHTHDQIVTDRSGYNAEVSLGGLTNTDQISLAPHVIDHPTRRESIVTFIHESMHAGNADVGDEGGYIDREDEFKTAGEDEKLHNAAHFEVVPRRMLGMGHAGLAYPGVTFIPSAPPPPPVGAPPPPPPPVGGAPVGPARTQKQEAMEAAYKAYKEAWTTGLNLHMLFVRNLRTPADWTKNIKADFGLAADTKFSECLPFWSKVEGLTIHNRTHINPASADPSTQPVTRIDVAISEAVIRRLAAGMDTVPQSEADANTLEATASAAERAAATTIEKERDLLIKLTARDIGTVTGNEVRDVKVVLELGAKSMDYSDMLKIRGPGSVAY